LDFSEATQEILAVSDLIRGAGAWRIDCSHRRIGNSTVHLYIVLAAGPGIIADTPLRNLVLPADFPVLIEARVAGATGTDFLSPGRDRVHDDPSDWGEVCVRLIVDAGMDVDLEIWQHAVTSGRFGPTP
jgi:hypothetical protein